MTKRTKESPRKSNNRQKHTLVIIVCEGEKTERIYFNHFRYLNKALHIEIVKGAEGKSYIDLINKAIEAKIKYFDGTESECYVWCVSDVDADHKANDYKKIKNKQLRDYADKAKSYGFNIALSNPCFELWFLLHYTSFTTRYIKSYDELILLLDKYIPNYHKNLDIYDQLLDKQNTALENSKKLMKYHQDKTENLDFFNVDTNPYTNVWSLVELLNSLQL
ncbi:MAG: RloB family protein [Eubacteriaceae bacterium]|nr:RloB family protein [Eubacteriaceae bacterium]